MSRNNETWGRRRSSFMALATLGRSASSRDEPSPKQSQKLSSALQTHRGEQQQQQQAQPKRRAYAPNIVTELSQLDLVHEDDEHEQRPRRPSQSSKTKRPSSVFDSLRLSTRATSDEPRSPDPNIEEPLSAASTTAPSLFGDGAMDGTVYPAVGARKVILHGEVQTSAGMFRKKKEYLVLTETHILRYKSQGKASDTWRAVPPPGGRPVHHKHGSMTSVSSASDMQTVSESSGDKDGRVSLRQVVAVVRADDGRPYFAIEVAYLDEDAGHASAVTLQFGNPEERDMWLKCIRGASGEARARQNKTISPANVEHAARILERDHDYDPAACAVYKIVQRQPSAKSGRSSAEDVTKVASTVCILAIGVHKVHIISVAKAVARTSSPSLTPNTSQASFGILTMTALRVSSTDDTFELTFRQPLQKPRQLLLASSAAYEIAAQLHCVENILRPECGHRLYKFSVPRDIEPLLAPAAVSNQEHDGLDGTLSAYCIAYGLNPANVRYTINYDCEDAPRFELLPPADPRRPDYGPIALLAIMRALRYNESFGSISFAGISLDSLNGLHDAHGREHVCSRTKRGTPIRLSMDELAQCSLLVQEVRALAATSKKLRRMDFSGCLVDTVPTAPLETLEDEPLRAKDIGCGIIEALVPLCKHQTTNVDWICLNGIQLSETDMDYLIGGAVDKSCHFRAIELNRCGLNDRSMNLILDALRAQDNTIEAIEIGGNTARLNPATFDSQLSIFGFVRKLNLSFVPQTSGAEPLLTAETLLLWRLQELRFSGTAINKATLDAVATYLAHPQSVTLHELFFDNAYLTGGDVATLLSSLGQHPGQHRDLHLDISHNRLAKDLEQVAQAIATGLAPSHFSMRAIEYREESLYRKMLAALTANKTIRYLDMSQTALPGDASEETCKALFKLFAENDTLVELDLSGEDSRLASSKFGPGINEALLGLKHNTALQSLRIEKQKLGLQGASTFVEVLKENVALRELHCSNNEIPLHGLTDLVNSLIGNTTLIYLPPMDDGRRAAFRSAEVTMKTMSGFDDPVSPGGNTARRPSLGSTSNVKRGLASVRRSAARTASAYTPSFPALPTSRSISSPEPRTSSTINLTLPANKTRGSPRAVTSASPPLAPASIASAAAVAPAVSFSVQDIQTTHRLLTEQWDRQVYRLAQYLERNWCLMHGYPAKMEVEDEKFERPTSVGSLGRMLDPQQQQQQAFVLDRTPRDEKDLYFDGTSIVSPDPAGAADPPEDYQGATAANESGAPEVGNDNARAADGKIGLGFKQFILDSRPVTPGSSDEADGGEDDNVDDVDDVEAPPTARKMSRGLDRVAAEGIDGRTTPTQLAFTT